MSSDRHPRRQTNANSRLRHRDYTYSNIAATLKPRISGIPRRNPI
jgi:hypothetical protein